MSKRKTEDYVVEVSGVFESSGDWIDDITEALNDRGIQAYVYKKEERRTNNGNVGETPFTRSLLDIYG